MGNEFTDFEDNAPTLTLEPVLDEPKAEAMVQPEAEAVKKEMEQTVLSPEEQQRIYRQMMDAPGVIVDDVCLSMVEKHLGTDALQAFYDTHDLAHAFTGVDSQCFYYTRR